MSKEKLISYATLADDRKLTLSVHIYPESNAEGNYIDDLMLLCNQKPRSLEQ